MNMKQLVGSGLVWLSLTLSSTGNAGFLTWCNDTLVVINLRQAWSSLSESDIERVFIKRTFRHSAEMDDILYRRNMNRSEIQEFKSMFRDGMIFYEAKGPEALQLANEAVGPDGARMYHAMLVDRIGALEMIYSNDGRYYYLFPNDGKTFTGIFPQSDFSGLERNFR